MRKTIHRSTARFLAACGFLIVAMTAAGCMLERQALVNPVIAPSQFSDGGSALLLDHWWLAFGDPALNGLIDRAMVDNLSIKAAWDRIEQARAVARRTGAAQKPILDASGSATRTVTKTLGADRVYADQFSLGLAAGYELDLWGELRSTTRASELEAAATERDLLTTAITLSAEIAGAWFRLVELRGQLGLLDGQVKTNEDYLDIIALKFRRGQVPATDVLQQRELLESTRGERYSVQSSIEDEELRLAVLLGVPPQRFTPPDSGILPAMPPLPSTGVPAAWMRRRPDLEAARLRVHAADYRVAAAIADRFPRLTLFGDARTASDRAHNLFENWLADIAASVAAPVVDGGRRKAEVDRTKALTSQLVHTYGQVLLDALAEVEGALVHERKQTELVDSLGKQLALSQQATDQTRDYYVKGTVDFTRLLTTLLSHQQLQRTYLRAQRELILFRVDLYRALAGGWDLEPPVRTANHGDKSQQPTID